MREVAFIRFIVNEEEEKLWRIVSLHLLIFKEIPNRYFYICFLRFCIDKID